MIDAPNRMQVQQLRASAQAKAEEAACYFATLNAEHATMKTEIGWTIAATAAHLANSAALNKGQLTALKKGKAARVPNFVIDGWNFIASRTSARKPIEQSIAKIREGTQNAVPSLDEWTDTELATRFPGPYYGAMTYGDALRYIFIDHFDEHLEQVRRALDKGWDTDLH
jgi:hypothetical protein